MPSCCYIEHTGCLTWACPVSAAAGRQIRQQSIPAVFYRFRVIDGRADAGAKLCCEAAI